MIQRGPMGQLATRPADADPRAADLLDPVALESRLVEARARRAEALARRRRPAQPPPAAAATAVPPVAADAPRQGTEAEPAAPRLRRPTLVTTATFLAGLCLGGVAAVLAPAALRDRPAAPAVPAAEAAPPADAMAAAPAPEPAAADAVRVAPAAVELPPVTAHPDSVRPAEPPPPAWAAATRVHVHHPPDARAAADAAAEALRQAGVAAVEVRAAPIPIARTNVRFYHAGDAEAARGVAALLPVPADGAAAEARDFTDFTPQPVAGMVEVWLAGDAPARAAGRGRAAPPTLPAAAQDVAAQAEQIARILVQRAVRTLSEEVGGR